MKKLVIISHPNIEESIINKRWIEELKKHSNHFTIHHLESAYPDGEIDVEQEQKLVEEHEMIIFQFPLYWYSSPPLLKKWQDIVLTHNWAYGSKATKMRNRGIALAISLGVPREDYQEQGKNRVTIEEILSPFKTMTLYIDADYRGHFGFYDAESLPPKEIVEQGTKDYIDYMLNI